MRIAFLIVAVFVALSLLAAYAHAGLIGLVDTAVIFAGFAVLLTVIWLIWRAND